MSLLDTLDGSFMNFAYGWAFSKPVRKLYYNLTITGLSVAVAFVVGSIELLSVAGITHVDLSLVGYFIVGLFVVTWAFAIAFWRLGQVEEKWAADIGSP
jgi:high-affinity nickel-transport protein